MTLAILTKQRGMGERSLRILLIAAIVLTSMTTKAIADDVEPDPEGAYAAGEVPAPRHQRQAAELRKEPGNHGDVSPQSSTGCTWSRYQPNGWVCLRINGSSTWVDSFRVWRSTDGTPNPADRWICDWQARVDIHYPNGLVDRLWSPFHSGCTWQVAVWDRPYGFDLPHGTRVCGSFWSANRSRTGGLPDGTACNYILR